MWATLLGIGRSALGGLGIWKLPLAFALGASLAVWPTLSLLSARADLVECANDRADQAEAQRDHVLNEVERLNESASRVRRETERLLEGSNAFRESISEVEFACDLEPVADSVQRRLDEVRSYGEARPSP